MPGQAVVIIRSDPLHYCGTGLAITNQIAAFHSFYAAMKRKLAGVKPAALTALIPSRYT